MAVAAVMQYFMDCNDDAYYPRLDYDFTDGITCLVSQTSYLLNGKYYNTDGMCRTKACEIMRMQYEGFCMD